MSPHFQPMISALTFLLTVQASGAVVTGTVRSAESNQPIPNAIVELTDIGRATATDPDGRYIFSEVPAGPQHILVRYIGHAPRTLNALVPSSGQLEINVSLVLRPVLLPNVEVHSAIALRDLEKRQHRCPGPRGLDRRSPKRSVAGRAGRLQCVEWREKWCWIPSRRAGSTFTEEPGTRPATCWTGSRS
jgi:hypothetical protein